MKTTHLAIGSLLALLLMRATRQKPASSPSERKPTTAPSEKLPSAGKRPPPQKKPKPVTPPKTGKAPIDVASRAFTDAMSDGKTEPAAREEALSAYRRAGGKNSAEESRIRRWFFD